MDKQTIELKKERGRALFGEPVPLSWWIPQRERAVLALVSTTFWTASIFQSLQKDAKGASIFAFYGLGVLYVLCSMANLAGGLRRALLRHSEGTIDEEQPRSLLQMFAVLSSVLVFNTIVLVIYLLKDTLITQLDILSIAAAGVVTIVLMTRYTMVGVFRHPLARGWLAIAFKALPQILLASLFLVNPPSAHAFTVWSLGSLTLLASLRFWPSFLAYRRDKKSKDVGGLMLGESGNILSVILMVAAWDWASQLL